MNTSTSLTHNPLKFNGTLVRKSDEARQVVEYGKRRRWDFKVRSAAPMIDRPVHIDEWWFVPIEQDTSPIPNTALLKVKYLLEECHVVPAGFVVAHEAPKLLGDAQYEKPPRFEVPEWLVPATKTGLKYVAYAALFVVALPFVMLVAGFAMGGIDPCLILVTRPDENGRQYWIEIERWYE